MSKTSKSNMSWDRAFAECNASFAKSKKLGEIANELFPIKGGVRDNFVGLTRDQTNEVYNQYVE
jgi:hypothetical protein